MSTTIAELRTNNPPAKQPKNFPDMLKSFLPEIQRALPAHLNGDRMARIALTAFRRTPKLAECDPRSVFAAVIQASQLGLEPDTLGRSYLVPYKANKNVNGKWESHYECQFIPGWKGLVELLNRSGQGTAWTGAVFQNDEFDYMLGDSPFVKHRPAGEFEADRLTHVYAIGRPKGAEWPIIEVWTMDRVIKHRDKYNKVGDKHYSYQNMEMYARKVVLLQVLKYMPASAELATAIALDNAADSTGQHIGIKDAIEGTWAPVPEDDQGEEEQRGSLVETAGNNVVDDTWPKKSGEGNHDWVDSAGEAFNQNKHAWSDQNNAPSVKKDGTFRARKGTGDSAPDPKADSHDGFVAKMKAATSQDALDEIADLVRSSDLTDDEKRSLDNFYDARSKQLAAAQDGGSDFSME